MLNQIKQFLRKNKDMAETVDYLVNYIKYQLMNSRKPGKNAGEFVMFGKHQLQFLVMSRTNGLNHVQINKVINVALRNVIASAKTSYVVTKNVIYIALL